VWWGPGVEVAVPLELELPVAGLVTARDDDAGAGADVLWLVVPDAEVVSDDLSLEDDPDPGSVGPIGLSRR